MYALPTILLVVALIFLTSCSSLRPTPIPIPTVIPDINEFATAEVLTRNAPPPGFEQVSFPQINDNLTALPGWRYTVTFEFTGIATGTTREVRASANAEISFNQLASARRVVFTTAGDLLGRDTPETYEAVRLGPDAFLVQNNVCLSNAGEDAATAADLTAGELIGGVNHAVPFGRKAVINGAEVWLYTFTQEDMNLPTIQLEEGGTMLMTGELWIAPAHNAVVRYYLTVDVTNARIFGRSVPSDGRAIIRYDLYDIGTPFNITQPFGC